MDDGTLIELVRIISARRTEASERRHYEEKIVRYTLDTLPSLTEAQKANLARLASLPDSEIDTSDIPVLTDEQ